MRNISKIANNIVKDKNKVIVKSYYIIKIQGYAGKRDKYVVEGFDKILVDKKSNKSYKNILTTDINEAHKFKYFGLKGMENALTTAMTCASKLNGLNIIKNKLKSDGFNIRIVGGDIFDDINNLHKYNKAVYNRDNFISWSKIVNEDTVKGMLKQSLKQAEFEDSKDNDENEYTENYVHIYKFLHHLKALRYNDIVKVAIKWNSLSSEDQLELAFGYSGEYSASRFIILMDYLNNKFRGLVD